MASYPAQSRSTAIHRLRVRLSHRSWPRLQMGLMVVLTGACGWLTSFALLRAGVEHLGWRYLAATGVAYLSFLALLRVWTAVHTGWRTGDWGDVDPGDLIDAGNSVGNNLSGLGGDFGGAGASDTFSTEGVSALGDALPSVSDLGAVADADELAAPILVVILAAVVVLAAVFGAVFVASYVISVAPGLLAELLLDGFLAAGLYRSFRGIDQASWWGTALRRTGWTFLLVAALAGGAGFIAHGVFPHAHSLGAVIHAAIAALH